MKKILVLSFVRAKNSTTYLYKYLYEQKILQRICTNFCSSKCESRTFGQKSPQNPPKISHILYAKSVENFQELPTTEVTKILIRWFFKNSLLNFWGKRGIFAPFFKTFSLFFFIQTLQKGGKIPPFPPEPILLYIFFQFTKKN